MEQYINKAAVVAELERRINEEIQRHAVDLGYSQGCVDSMRNVLSFLDTLEVKEVDLEKELDEYTADNFWALKGNNESPYLLDKDDMLKVAKHFFELGLKAKGE